MLSHLRYPITPGSMVTGKVVQMGQNVKHMKLGYQVVGSFHPLLSLGSKSLDRARLLWVAGVAAHGGLAEYAVLNADYACELKKKEGATQQAFAEVFEGARCEGKPRVDARVSETLTEPSRQPSSVVSNTNRRVSRRTNTVESRTQTNASASTEKELTSSSVTGEL